mmetsp:Transcript_18999/g.56596  ORF Transcript_18999/g.56596 Transcript_18999/m.56596 type:complete len:234 (+) Transcript_18999:207-908(+)
MAQLPAPSQWGAGLAPYQWLGRDFEWLLRAYSPRLTATGEVDGPSGARLSPPRSPPPSSEPICCCAPNTNLMERAAKRRASSALRSATSCCAPGCRISCSKRGHTLSAAARSWSTVSCTSAGVAMPNGPVPCNRTPGSMPCARPDTVPMSSSARCSACSSRGWCGMRPSAAASPIRAARLTRAWSAAAASTMRATSAMTSSRTRSALGLSSHSASSHSCEGRGAIGRAGRPSD